MWFLVGTDTFILSEIINTLLISFMIPFLFMTVSICLSGSSYRFGKSSLSIFIILISYLVGYLGLLSESKGDYLRYLSPFEIFLVSDFTSFNILSLVIVLAISLVLLSIGLVNYRRREYFR